MTALGRDQHHAVCGAGAVDGGCRRALEDVDRLDVVRIYVRRAILGDFSTAAGLVERQRQVGGDVVVVDRLTVDDEQRLVGAENRRRSTNFDGASRARLAALRADLDVGGFSRQGVDDVLWLRRAPDERAVDGVDDVAQPRTDARRARARHHDFLEVERITRKHEIECYLPCIQRDRRAPRRVADQTSRERYRLAGGTSRRNGKAVTARLVGLRAEAHAFEEDGRIRDRYAAFAGDSPGDRGLCRCQCGKQGDQKSSGKKTRLSPHTRSSRCAAA